MAIQITLNAKKFTYTGIHNGRKYDQLYVKSASKGRIYFSIINEGIRMSTMAKQMQLEEGKVYVSFGKEGKLVIGTYKEV